jgi:hypothetical protein
MGVMRASASVLAMLVVGLGEALAQAPTPAPNMVAPPALQRFQIQQDTPAERDAFLRRGQAQESGSKPEEVPPLPAQQIAPPASQSQR